MPSSAISSGPSASAVRCGDAGGERLCVRGERCGREGVGRLVGEVARTVRPAGDDRGPLGRRADGVRVLVGEQDERLGTRRSPARCSSAGPGRSRRARAPRRRRAPAPAAAAAARGRAPRRPGRRSGASVFRDAAAAVRMSSGSRALADARRPRRAARRRRRTTVSPTSALSSPCCEARRGSAATLPFSPAAAPAPRAQRGRRACRRRAPPRAEVLPRPARTAMLVERECGRPTANDVFVSSAQAFPQTPDTSAP